MTLDMNTPENDIKSINNLSENTQQSFEQLQAYLLQNQFRRLQGRDYGRILRESNKPAQWYQPPPKARSIYFYDPHYQKYLQQQQSTSLPNIRLIPTPVRMINQSKSRSTYTSHLPHLSNNHQQRPKRSSKLLSVTTLPPITRHNKPNDE